MIEFTDTHMIEPEEEEFFDTSEKILKLSDVLAEEIVLENIKDQLDNIDVDTINQRINYVTLFKEKYESVKPEDDCYDEEYIKDALARVGGVLSTGLKKRFGVELGTDLDFLTPTEYLADMETLYEFLFIRQQENIIDYIKHRLYRERQNFIKTYLPLMDDDTHSKDLFVVQSKKKFKDSDDVLIMHFMNEIINDIKDTTTSAYTLFETIANLDLYEEFNNRMSELIINYGNKLVLNNDEESAHLYMKPLEDSVVFTEIRNNVLMDYISKCELNND